MRAGAVSHRIASTGGGVTQHCSSGAGPFGRRVGRGSGGRASHGLRGRRRGVRGPRPLRLPSPRRGGSGACAARASLLRRRRGRLRSQRVRGRRPRFGCVRIRREEDRPGGRAARRRREGDDAGEQGYRQRAAASVSGTSASLAPLGATSAGASEPFDGSGGASCSMAMGCAFAARSASSSCTCRFVRRAATAISSATFSRVSAGASRFTVVSVSRPSATASKSAGNSRAARAASMRR